MIKYFFISVVVLCSSVGSLFAQTGWVQINNPIKGRLEDISFLNANEGYLLGQNELFFTKDGGTTWEKKNLPDNLGYLVHFSTVANGLVATQNGGKLFQTIDSGSTWVERIIPSQVRISQFNFPNPTFGYMGTICSNCTTLMLPFTNDGGLTIQSRYIGKNTDIWGLTFRTPAVGIGVFNEFEPTHAYLMSTNDSGKNWIRRDSGISYPSGNGYWASITSLSNGDWISSFSNYLDGSTTFYKSSDDGKSWQIASIVNGSIYNTTFSGKDGYGVGEITDSQLYLHPIIYSSSDYGTSWVSDVIPSIDNHFYFTLVAPETKVAYTISDSDIILKTTTGGMSEVKNNTIFSNTKISPEITSGVVTISFDAVPSAESIEIYDAIGRQVSGAQIPPEATSYRIDVSNYSSGMYLAKLRGKMYRFVKVGN